MHHYTWWRAAGDGTDRGLFYYPQAEDQHTVMSHVRPFPAAGPASCPDAVHPPCPLSALTLLCPFSTPLQYYDVPSLSVRAALYHLMRASVAGFKASGPRGANWRLPAAPHSRALPRCRPGRRACVPGHPVQPVTAAP